MKHNIYNLLHACSTTVRILHSLAGGRICCDCNYGGEQQVARRAAGPAVIGIMVARRWQGELKDRNRAGQPAASLDESQQICLSTLLSCPPVRESIILQTNSFADMNRPDSAERPCVDASSSGVHSASHQRLSTHYLGHNVTGLVTVHNNVPANCYSQEVRKRMGRRRAGEVISRTAWRDRVLRSRSLRVMVLMVSCVCTHTADWGTGPGAANNKRGGHQRLEERAAGPRRMPRAMTKLGACGCSGMFSECVALCWNVMFTAWRCMSVCRCCSGVQCDALRSHTCR